jgi:tetratricopeptide (TPR) repeat protein
MEADNGDYYTASSETLTRRCEDRSSAITFCDSEVQNQIYYATLALLRGHTQEAEARYSNADKYRSDALRQLNGPYRTAINLEIWFNARILYLLLAERIDDAIAEMKALVTERASNYPAEDVLDLWSRMGHSRALAKLTLMASRDSILDAIVFSTALYRDFDAAVLREAGPDALTARLQVIGALMGAYENAGALWRNQMTVSLECRLGLVALLEGDQAKADALYVKTREVFMRSEADFGWEVGLCLFRMAPQLGKSADQPALMAQMQRHYEESKKSIAAGTREFMSGAAGDDVLVAHGAQFGKLNALISSKPQAYTFLDEARFRQSAATALDLTKEVRKTDPTFGNRDNEVIMVINYVLDRYLYFGE